MKRYLAAAAAALFLGTGLLLNGCQAIPEDILPSLSRPASAENSQTLFEELTGDIFRENAASSILDRHYLMAEPENFNLSKPESLYGNADLEGLQKSSDAIAGYLDRLNAIDPDSLSPEDQLDYQILKAYLETESTCQGLELYAQPLAPTIGVQAQLPILLAEYEFYREEDIDDYFSLLEGLGAYFDQILSLEQEKASQGLMMSDDAIDRVLDSCEPYLDSSENCVLAGTFLERLDRLNGLDSAKKEDYVRRHEELIRTAFVPAYEKLMEGLSGLKGSGKVQGGLCRYPDGREYYRYLVYSSTYTSCRDVTTLRKTIERRIERDFRELASIVTRRQDLLDSLPDVSFAFTEPHEILQHLMEQTALSYPAPICEDYTIRYVPKALEPVLSPAFYLTPPIDRDGSNTIYINQGSASSGQDHLFTTLAHEGYPGHLYQTTYFLSTDPSPFRHLLSFGAYTEGWATYVEMESYQMDESLDQDLARLLALNSSITLGLHAYIDIMVNDQGWDISQIHNFITSYYDDPDQEFSAALYEAMVDNPSNYLEYYVGYLEFSDMREKAEEALGEAFDLMEFHRFLLDTGPAPFSVLRKGLERWIQEQNA